MKAKDINNLTIRKGKKINNWQGGGGRRALHKPHLNDNYLF